MACGKMNSQYERYLDNDNNQGSSSIPTFAPTRSPVQTPKESVSGGRGGVALFVLVLFIVAGLVMWLAINRWRRRREQRLLQYRSDQANQVLGDMQMVPNEDLDDGLI